MIERIDHIAIAVTDQEQNRAYRFFVDILGAVPGARDHDRRLQFDWQVFSLGDLSRLELLTPTAPHSFLHNFLDRHPKGAVHHLTLQTPDLEAAMAHLDRHGIPYFGYGRCGDTWQEVFIHPRDAFGVLIQIAQFDAATFLSSSVQLEQDCRWSVTPNETGCELALAHPGGGTATVALTRSEAAALAKALHDAADRGAAVT